jgi:hypothetical protein
MLPSNFFIKALATHGGRYSYSKAGGPDKKGNICIVCPQHGEFWQNTYRHLRGYGCPVCGRLKQADSKRQAAGIDFPFKARDIHGDRYDYSQVHYMGNTVKVAIRCPLHGPFHQTPHSHLLGKGCPKCGKEKRFCDAGDGLNSATSKGLNLLAEP